MNKKISVIMSAYNASQTLNKSIESILNQTYTNFEFLIVDDNSNDETFNIIENYKSKDSRIKFFKNSTNIGLTKSLNFLIDNSDGEIIARQDADDISLDYRFEKQIIYLNEYKVVTSRAFSIQSGKKIPGISFYLPTNISMKFKNPYIHGTLMIDKMFLLEIGKYDENYRFAQDYKLFLDIRKKGYKIKSLKDTLYLLNTVDNISTNQKIEQKKYFDFAKNGNKLNKFIS